MAQLAPPMPEPSFAQINGIRMAYYEAGPRTGVPSRYSITR